MWRHWQLLYLTLLTVRLYFALSPSYIHPDEHFQGPEVIAGEIFGWQSHKTWEFTSTTPIRSFFPLWFAYGIPIQLLDWLVPGTSPPSPKLTFYFLRTVFFLMSFVLEDWALQDLLPNPRHRGKILLLLSSSYVTWTYQTHTFSNSLETLTVLWSLVLIERISKSKTPAWIASGLLGFVAVFGVFNRITFPAFLLLPALRLLPHFARFPGTLFPLLLVAGLTASYAVYLDTLFYAPSPSTSSPPAPLPWPLSLLPFHATITPLNNILYNISPSNLALHGIHPRYTHLLANLPQLLGPALVSIRPSPSLISSLPFLSALGGVAVLSAFAHQEARFLLPAVPLLLTAVRRGFFRNKVFLGSWIVFNAIYGVLMGAYHQAGIVPAQLWLGEQSAVEEVVYWKTYSPPEYLLGHPRTTPIKVVDVMGAAREVVKERLVDMACEKDGGVGRYLVMPESVKDIEEITEGKEWRLRKAWGTRRHLNLDDMDFGDDGVAETLKRVVGRRGLGVWEVEAKDCAGR